MKRYCGIDLHSNNHVVTVIDKQDHRVYKKNACRTILQVH